MLGGFQTYAFSDADLRRSLSFKSFSERIHSIPRRPAKKMNVDTPPRNSIQFALHGVPPEIRKPSNRVSPGGKTSIESCLHLY